MLLGCACEYGAEGGDMGGGAPKHSQLAVSGDTSLMARRECLECAWAVVGVLRGCDCCSVREVLSSEDTA